MLVTKEIQYTYPGSFDLKDINLVFKPKEITGIIGQSGSGKTTLLHLLAGLKEPISGEILLEGKQLPTPSKKMVPGHEKIKLVTQQNTLFPHISIAENIAYELRYFEKSYQTQRVDTLSKSLNIKHLLSKLPRELSGGEIQRVMVAKALADEPKVLLLDEPMANLDRLHKKKIINDLKAAIAEENIACVLVTHDIFDAFGLADKLIILKDGEVVQIDNSEGIYLKPKNLYVAELTGYVNSIKNSEETLYFRPENVILKSKGEYTGTVVSSVFQGAYYENIINTATGLVNFQSPKVYALDCQVHFNIDSFLHFN